MEEASGRIAAFSSTLSTSAVTGCGWVWLGLGKEREAEEGTTLIL